MWASSRAIIATCIFGLFTVVAQSQDAIPPADNSLSQTNSATTSGTQETSSHVPDWHASAPVVSFENGQLSISAQNSTLQQVLDAIHQKTGTKVEAPFLDPGKISVQLGPGNPVEVIGKLLYGIRFNYIIVGKDGRTQEAVRVIITPRQQGVVASNFRPVKPAIPAPAAAEKSADETSADATNPDGTPVEEAKKDDKADPKSDKDQDKDKEKDADKDKVADNKTPDSADDNAKTDDEQDPAVSAMADAPSSAAERMANLPDGMNPALASLYPSLFGGQNGSGTGGGPSTGNPNISPYPTAQRTPQAYNPIPIQYNSAGQPILPTNIPPEMWGLYPSNLLDLVKNNVVPVLPPPTPLIPGSSGNGQGVLWTQGMKPPGH